MNRFKGYSTNDNSPINAKEASEDNQQRGGTEYKGKGRMISMASIGSQGKIKLKLKRRADPNNSAMLEQKANAPIVWLGS